MQKFLNIEANELLHAQEYFCLISNVCHCVLITYECDVMIVAVVCG